MELTKEYFDEQIGKLATRSDLEPFSTKEDLAELRTDVGSLKSDMQSVKTDVATLKDDVTGLKTDIIALQDDMRSVKNDLSEIKQTLAELNQRDKEDSDAFAKTLVKHDERLTHLEKDVKQLKLKQA